MDFKTFFAPEIGIRLTEDLDGFVCTVRRGLFRRDSTTFSLAPDHRFSSEALAHRSYPVVVLRPLQKDPRL